VANWRAIGVWERASLEPLSFRSACRYRTPDLAYRLLVNRDYPSWGYLVDHGAATMWERWNGDRMRGDPSMNSYNHYAYGAVADWIYSFGAIIDAMPSDPGFRTIYLHPNFNPRLGGLDFSYASPYGAIRSQWSMTGRNVTWTVTIPANAMGRLPLADLQVDRFTLDGHKLARSSKVRLVSAGYGGRVYNLPAGTYTFKMIEQQVRASGSSLK
jgi:alpha-L-rhamnosidase